jgi:hypothetical protein
MEVGGTGAEGTVVEGEGSSPSLFMKNLQNAFMEEDNYARRE